MLSFPDNAFATARAVLWRDLSSRPHHSHAASRPNRRPASNNYAANTGPACALPKPPAWVGPLSAAC